MGNTLTLITLVLVATVLATVLHGAWRWQSGTRELRARLAAARAPTPTQRVDFREIDGLPAPVQRYFRAALRDGQAMVAGVRLRHAGRFNLSESAEQWKAFTSEQLVVTRRPGFDWNARIVLLPGVPVLVHDAYVAGEGLLHASLLGVFSLAQLRGTGALADGELMRFFAEAAWYPTALLPSQGVRWETRDERSARATLTDGERSVTLLFTFNESGLIDTVHAAARARSVGATSVPTPWRGRFWNYAARDGMQVPLEGEVSWELPEGPRAYWRGTISGVDYEWVR